MYRQVAIILSFLLCTTVNAHEMTPAYPKLVISYMDGVHTTKMKLFNRRDDIEYYEIQVYTDDWRALPFAATSKVIKIGFNKRKTFSVYISSRDVKKVTYICTESKVFKKDKQVTLVSSRICSKIKQDE